MCSIHFFLNFNFFKLPPPVLFVHLSMHTCLSIPHPQTYTNQQATVSPKKLYGHGISMEYSKKSTQTLSLFL